jgi:hypothetical protein
VVYVCADSVSLALTTHSKPLSTGKAIEKQKGAGNVVEQVLYSIKSVSELTSDSRLLFSIYLAADTFTHSAISQSASRRISVIIQFTQTVT